MNLEKLYWRQDGLFDSSFIKKVKELASQQKLKDLQLQDKNRELLTRDSKGCFINSTWLQTQLAPVINDTNKTLGWNFKLSKFEDLQYTDLADWLNQKRKDFSKSLSQQIEAMMEKLNMDGATFQVEIQQKESPDETIKHNDQNVKYGPKGYDDVEFYLSANPGEAIKPLSKVAFVLCLPLTQFEVTIFRMLVLPVPRHQFYNILVSLYCQSPV